MTLDLLCVVWVVPFGQINTLWPGTVLSADEMENSHVTRTCFGLLGCVSVFRGCVSVCADVFRFARMCFGFWFRAKFVWRLFAVPRASFRCVLRAVHAPHQHQRAKSLENTLGLALPEPETGQVKPVPKPRMRRTSSGDSTTGAESEDGLAPRAVPNTTSLATEAARMSGVAMPRGDAPFSRDGSDRF